MRGGGGGGVGLGWPRASRLLVRQRESQNGIQAKVQKGRSAEGQKGRSAEGRKGKLPREFEEGKGQKGKLPRQFDNAKGQKDKLPRQFDNEMPCVACCLRSWVACQQARRLLNDGLAPHAHLSASTASTRYDGTCEVLLVDVAPRRGCEATYGPTAGAHLPDGVGA